MAKWADLIIRWSFYLLFFFVPLIFFSGSFELFEYNKMMLTYALTLVVGAAWLIKIVVNHKINFQKTYLIIPLALYLGSHILSTIFSIDVQTSIWGYYSRFHEGLVATTCYLILYFAVVSNLKKQDIMRIFYVSLASGTIVSLWGILEHFGSSPSCWFITGSGGVDCWIQDVKSRVFATLGQPNWMAAYLDVLILISLGLIVQAKKVKPYFLIFTPLFFAALLFTRSRSGILGLMLGLGVFAGFYIYTNRKDLNFKKLLTKPLLIVLGALLVLTVLFGLPFAQTENWSLERITSQKSIQPVTKTVDPTISITESGDIRNIVWEGALKVWQRYPVFGSGVETFAYSYYKDRPVAHNLVSEWDFLYNKAHNEYLNILATTGLVGTLAYLSILGVYTWWFLKSKKDVLTIALYAGWTTILVTNFFGFSVVIIGLFFFLIPAFSLILKEPEEEIKTHPTKPLTLWSWVFISIVLVVALIGILKLWSMWQADKSYAYGKNLDGVQQYQAGYKYLAEAVETSPGEPTYRDELAYNESVLALAYFGQSSTSAEAKFLTDEAIKNSNEVVSSSPSILSFWKTRTRLFYNLANIDKRYLFEALNSIKKAAELAPTDAKVNYNYGLLLGQTGDINGGIVVLKRVTQMKPDYADAHFALGTYYDQKGDKEKARAEMEYMLNKIGNDDRAKKWLEENKQTL